MRSSRDCELHSGDETTEFESVFEVPGDAVNSEIQDYIIKDIEDNEQEIAIQKEEVKEHKEESICDEVSTKINKKNAIKEGEVNQHSTNTADSKRHYQRKSPIFLKNIVVKVPRMVLKEAKSRMRKTKKLCDGSGSELGDESTWSTVSTESYVDYMGDPINLHCAVITADEPSSSSEKEKCDANEQKAVEKGNVVEVKKVINNISNDVSDLVNNKDILEQLPEDKTEISEILRFLNLTHLVVISHPRNLSEKCEIWMAKKNNHLCVR
nr:hypothetical transcript [Hymenolepis microstoma]